MPMNKIGQIYLTRNLINQLKIPISEEIIVRVGVKTARSQLVVRNRQRSSFVVSSQLAQYLNLKNPNRLQIRYDSDNEMIHIGPIVGIMTEYLPNKTQYSPKSVQAELIFLSNMGIKLPAQYYIFTPGSINWSNKTVRGYTYQKTNQQQGNWISAEYPIPDVVYDRVASRRGEARSRVRYTKKRLMSMPYLKYFNPNFLNKWKVHCFLQQNENLTPYLPETRPLNLVNLTEMSGKYKTLYLKPCNGSLGSGIIKVVRCEDERLRYTVYRAGRHSGYANNPDALMQATRSSRRGWPYIVQEGINLSTYQSCAFDIRIIYQKNGSGEWIISKKFVRVAPRGSSVANMSRGGKAETAVKVFNYIFNKDRELIESKNEELSNLCKIVADTLEEISQKVYGELGLDIGIDKEGNFWLIEVNSKPRKTTETELSQGIVRNTFSRPLKYAIHLAGFKNKK